MCKMGFFKGMGAGLVVGMCVGMTLAPDKKRGKKMVGRAVKSFGEIIDDLTESLGL